MLRRIFNSFGRFLVHVKMSAKEKRLAMLPSEQMEILKFTKSVIKQIGTEILYGPKSGLILVKGNDRTVLIRETSVVVITGVTSVSVEIDDIIKREIIDYISLIFERKFKLVQAHYRENIKNLNDEFS